MLSRQLVFVLSRLQEVRERLEQVRDELDKHPQGSSRGRAAQVAEDKIRQSLHKADTLTEAVAQLFVLRARGLDDKGAPAIARNGRPG